MESFIDTVPTLNGDAIGYNHIVMYVVNKNGSEDQKNWTIDYRCRKTDSSFEEEDVVGSIPYSEENLNRMLMKMPQIVEIIDNGQDPSCFSVRLNNGIVDSKTEEPILILVRYDRNLLSQLKEIEQSQQDLKDKRDAQTVEGLELAQKEELSDLARSAANAVESPETIRRIGFFPIGVAAAMALAGLTACAPAKEEPTQIVAPVTNEIVIPRSRTVSTLFAMENKTPRILMSSIENMTPEQKKAMAEKLGKELWSQIQSKNPITFAVMGYQNYIDNKTGNIVNDGTSTARSLSEQECIEFMATMVLDYETEALSKMNDEQRKVYFKEMYLIENMLISESTNPNNSVEKRVDIVEIIKEVLTAEEYELLKNTVNVVRNYKNSSHNIPTRYEMTANTGPEKTKMAKVNRFRSEYEQLLSYANETFNNDYGFNDSSISIRYLVMNVLSIGLEKMPEYSKITVNGEDFFHTDYNLAFNGLKWQVRNENGQQNVYKYNPEKAKPPTCGWEKVGPLSDFKKYREKYNSTHSGRENQITANGTYPNVCVVADMLREQLFGNPHLCDPSYDSIWRRGK